MSRYLHRKDREGERKGFDYPPGDWRNSPEARARRMRLYKSHKYDLDERIANWFVSIPTPIYVVLASLALLMVVVVGVSEYKKPLWPQQQNTERIMDFYDTSRDGVLDHKELSNLLEDRKKFK